MLAKPDRHSPAGYPKLHVETPLVYSKSLSEISGHNVYIKLETKQLTGSFKPRGVGRSCYAAVQRLGPKAHLIIASGGNAGQACALSAQTLGVKCTVHVHARTEQAIEDRIRGWGADVKRSHGVWEDVNQAALEMAAADPNGVYVHAFEGDDLILGHTSVVDEIYDQLPSASASVEPATYPDVVTCSVGGGGLIRGIMLGLSERAEETNTPPAHMIGISGIGGDSFSKSLETDDEIIPIEKPFSVAKSLVCQCCSPIAVRDARQYAKNGKTSLDLSDDIKGKTGPYFTAVSVDDALGGSAAWRSTEELHHNIELSCGVAMTPAYYPSILDYLVKEKGLKKKLNVVIVACGGTRVSDEDIKQYRAQYGQGYGKIIADGIELEDIPKAA